MSTVRRTTIKDIARAAGFSTAAVSQALRPLATSNIKLNPDTVERIKRVASEMNYQAHSGARSIRSNRFHNIGYFTAKTGILTNTPTGYLAGAHDIAEAHGFRITLIRLSEKNVENIGESMPGVFSERNLDALIIESYNELAHLIHKQLQASRMPVVFINDKNESNSVFVDDEWAAKELTRHLLEKGHSRICFVQREVEGGPTISQMHHSAIDRETGYRKAMRKAKKHPAIHKILTKGVVGLGIELRDENWDAISQYEAVIAYDDDLANLIARAAYDRRLWIPDALAIASFNGDYASLSAWQKLTTMRTPSYEMGCKAGEMAVKIIRMGADTLLPSSAHRPMLISGQTA
jgi:LacI family transcriptional regulator